MTIKKRRFRIFIVFLLLINLFNVKKLDAVIPYYVFPSKSNLKKQSIEIGKSAYQLLYFGQYEEGLKLAELAISLYKNDEKLWAILVEAQIANKLYDKALISIENGKRIKPKMSELFFAESSIYLKKKNIKKAKVSLLKGLELKPENVNGIFQLGNIFLIEKEYKKALNEFNKAIIVKKNFWQAENNKGLAFYELEKKQEAINSFKKAIDIEENAEPILALAASLGINNQNESILLAKKALKKDPNYLNSEYRKEQLWGEKLQNSTETL